MQRKHRRTRRAWALAGLALAILVVGGVAGVQWTVAERRADPGGGPPPRVAFDRTTIDLGDLPFNRAGTAVFTVSNAGSGDLRLAAASPAEALQGC